MITKVLNRGDLAAALKADGHLTDRPDLARYVLSGQSQYTCKDVTYALEGSEAARSGVDRSSPAAQPVHQPPAITDEEVERRIDAIEARRKAAPTPGPFAPSPVANESRRAEVPSDDASSAFLAEITRRVSLSDDERWKEDDDALMRGAVEIDVRSLPVAESRQASSPDDASLEFVALCMRGVNDVAASNARAGRDPSEDFLRLVTQNLPDFDGPEAA